MRGLQRGKARATAALAALALVAGCQKHQPTGQVVATVDDQDVTRRDLAADLAASNVPKGADLKAIGPLAVNDLVNRKLLVEQAKRQGLDKNPDYLAAANRLQELALAQQLVTSWTAKVPTPSQPEAQTFISANPQFFEDRKVYALDQLQAPAAGIDPKALAPLHSMDAVVEYLRAHKVSFRRAGGTLDPLTVPAATARKLASLAPGEPFVVNRGGTLTISAITEARPAPVPEEQRVTVATQLLKRQNVQDAINGQIKSLRAGAKISYQPGFAPPTPPAGAQ